MISQLQLRNFYEDHLQKQLLPFWIKAIDEENGGVFTGFDNEGKALLHRDKFVWSQGRFLWLMSRLAVLHRKGVLSHGGNNYQTYAQKTYQFLKKYAFMDNGNCYFLLTEDGKPKELVPDEGHDISIYVDCFVTMGFAEYAISSGDFEAYTIAKATIRNVEKRIANGTARSEPYPVPKGYSVHGFKMIVLNTFQSLYQAASTFGCPSDEVLYRKRAKTEAEAILNHFCDTELRIREVLFHKNNEVVYDNPTSLLARHLNPGHSVESLWFVLTEAKQMNNQEMIDKAIKALKAILEIGWDKEHGGLYRYIDLNGGQPQGTKSAQTEKFDTLIEGTWDMKLWWPHSEGLYACMYAYSLTKDEQLLEWYRKFHHYTFKVFPAEAGEEWIQIRSREGTPVSKVVALPVKDPYHIIRNVLLMLELP